MTLTKQAADSPLAQGILGLPKTGDNAVNVRICAFLDECCGDIVLAATVAAALGIDSFAGRSCTYQGRGIHFEEMTPGNLRALLAHVYGETGVVMDEFGLRLGKVYLLDDKSVLVRGQKMSHVDYFGYVERVFELGAAVSKDSSLGRTGRPALQMRLFDTYPGEGRTHEACFADGMSLTGRTLTLCRQYGLTPGVEVEVGLQGRNADSMLRMSEAVPGYDAVIDIGNLDSSGYGDEGAAAEAARLIPISAPWMHVKAFLGPPGCKPGDKVDEAAINKFGPCHIDVAHHLFFAALSKSIPGIEKRHGLAAGDFRLTLEPHFLKGGQFGGFTGAKGLGQALRSLQYLLAQTGIGFRLSQYADIRPDNRILVESC